MSDDTGHVTDYPDAPSCHRRHICPDTDMRVAEAARDWLTPVALPVPDGVAAYRRLVDAVEAQREPEP